MNYYALYKNYEKEELINMLVANKKRKEELAKEVEKLIDKLNKKDKEIERLNNIINELEKELDLNLPFKVVGVRRLKKKLQELKGSESNEKN